MRKRIARSLFLVTLLGVAAAVGIAWVRDGGDPPRNELILYGNVDIRQVELAFFATERITGLTVDEGDSVEKGQLLGMLDTERFRYQLALAEARHQSQSEVVARLEAGTRLEEICKARADLAAAQAKAVDARRTYERVKTLAAKRVMTAEDLDDATSAHENTKAHVQAAQAALDLAVAGPRKEDIAAAKAELAEREAEINLARRNLADARLYAPSDGVIQDRLLEVGDMASPEKTVFTLALRTPLWVRAYVDEPDLGKVFPGMSAIVKTDSYPEKVYRGWVGFISPTAQFTPKPVETPQLRTHLVYQVRVYVDDPQNELRLGMPATVILSLNQPQSAEHLASGGNVANNALRSHETPERSNTRDALQDVKPHDSE